VLEELQVQMTLEGRWENLVRTIAIEAGDQSTIFALLRQIIEQAALNVLSLQTLPMRYVPPLPPQFEQSLLAIARKKF
jgi:hypothetical protein